jgi:AcrR family transcriptional regulator
MTVTALTESQQARRQRILRAARDLAVRGGYEAVQMRHVAAEADVALGTLYRYFPSKEQLLVSVNLRAVRGLAERVDRDPPQGTTSADRVLALLGDATARLQEQPRLAAATIRALVSGDPDVAPVVADVREVTGHLLRTAIDDDAVGDDVVGLLEHLWLSAQVGWIGGITGPEGVMETMEQAVRRLIPDC